LLQFINLLVWGNALAGSKDSCNVIMYHGMESLKGNLKVDMESNLLIQMYEITWLFFLAALKSLKNTLLQFDEMVKMAYMS